MKLDKIYQDSAGQLYWVVPDQPLLFDWTFVGDVQEGTERYGPKPEKMYPAEPGL